MIENHTQGIYFQKKKNVMVNVKNHLRTNYNIWKIATNQDICYITGCLKVYHYFKQHCKMKAISLSKQQALDTDPETKQLLISLKT